LTESITPTDLARAAVSFSRQRDNDDAVRGATLVGRPGNGHVDRL